MAFVTPVFECNCQTPTVVEVLTCWTASVMDLPGTFKMPQVGTESTSESRIHVWSAAHGSLLAM